MEKKNSILNLVKFCRKTSFNLCFPSKTKHNDLFRDFGCFCRQWLDHYGDNVKISTYSKYQGIMNKHILPYFGGVRIEEIDTALVQKFKRRLIDEKQLSDKSVKDILTVLKSVIRYVETIADVIVSAEIEIPKVAKKEIRILSNVEQKRLVEYLLQDLNRYHIAILLSLFTGMRIGEVCGLRWRNVSLEERIIRVDSTVQRVENYDSLIPSGTKVVIDTPKSYSSIRSIPLTETIIALLTKLRCETPDAFVLTGREDCYVEPRVLQYHFSKCADECRLQNVHFHTLRHTFATRCAEVDFEIKCLSEILGHSNPSVTLERYVHPSIELKRANMNKLTFLGY